MKNKKNIKLKKMFTISIGCFFVLLSLLFFFPCLKLFYYSYHSQQWHKVKCDILFCKVMTEYESSGKGGMAKSYSLDLNYKYIYNDKEYVGNRYGFSHKTGFYNQIEKINEDVLIGCYKDCYVNPNNPRETVLNRNIEWFWFFTPMIIAIFFLFAGGILLVL